MTFKALERDFLHESSPEIVSEMWTMNLFLSAARIAASKSIQLAFGEDKEDCSIVVIDPIVSFFHRRTESVC